MTSHSFTLTMTRHYFRFTMIDGSTVELTTTDAADAEKVAKHRWSTGGGTYFTPWLTPLVEDRYGDQVPDPDGLARVNLIHVMGIEYRKQGT
jgi:hypothetical protein